MDSPEMRTSSSPVASDVCAVLPNSLCCMEAQADDWGLLNCPPGLQPARAHSFRMQPSEAVIRATPDRRFMETDLGKRNRNPVTGVSRIDETEVLFEIDSRRMDIDERVYCRIPFWGAEKCLDPAQLNKLLTLPAPVKDRSFRANSDGGGVGGRNMMLCEWCSIGDTRWYRQENHPVTLTVKVFWSTRWRTINQSRRSDHAKDSFDVETLIKFLKHADEIFMPTQQ